MPTEIETDEGVSRRIQEARRTIRLNERLMRKHLLAVIAPSTPARPGLLRRVVRWLIGAVVDRGYVRFRLRDDSLRVHKEFVVLMLNVGRALRSKSAAIRGEEK